MSMQLNGDGDNNKKLTHVLSELTFYARTVIAIIHYRIIFFSTALFVLVLSVLMYSVMTQRGEKWGEEGS